MSLVAEAKAAIQKQAKVVMKKILVGKVRPTPKSAMEINSCMTKNQLRLVLFKSTNGLQSGFKTHGRYSQLVYNPMSALLMPSFLYIMTDTVTTITYGSPCVKYNRGTHAHARLSFWISAIRERKWFGCCEYPYFSRKLTF